MYFYDDMILGSSFTTTKFHTNIDYLEYVPVSNSNHYLNNNNNLINFIKYINSNPEYKIHNNFLYQRLLNICWRRIYKNYQQLNEVNPLVINWDKNSDITWLFGPQIEQPHINTQTEEQEQQLVVDDEYDNISISSYDSFSSLDSEDFPSSTRRRSTTSTNSSLLDSDINMSSDESDDGEHRRRSILRKKTTNNHTIKHKKKRVSFNYIVNTREIINGMSVDYDFLDKDCL
ncbi:REG1 Resistance to glucose repression protein 1 [Candida maltosa Xu316]